MSEYTPTVKAFRGVYGEMCAVWCRDDALAEFDRFIARIQAEAWAEGHASGRDYQADGWNADAHDPEDDNPYREEAGL